MFNQLPTKQFTIIDNKQPNSVFNPFALDTSLLNEVNTNADQGFLHFWHFNKAVVLGMMDQKLPYFNEAVTYLSGTDYEPVLRHQGGLAVVCDVGVVNISFILPQTTPHFTIDQGYELMVQLVATTLQSISSDIQVKAYEIKDSYCPGKYDLSINGKKFAGLAQRRHKNGVLISAYFSIHGPQDLRGQLIREFYHIGLQNQPTKWQYPLVNPDSMANLSDLLDTPITVDQFKQMVTQTMLKIGVSLTTKASHQFETAAYEDALAKMATRNQILLK